jgi:CTP:molybdopterin cytidylyltransferase MocA
MQPKVNHHNPLPGIMKEASVIILAAGVSKRMGVPKFQLLTNEGHTFLETIIKKYLDLGCKEIVVVANRFNISAISSATKLLSKDIKIVLNPDETSGKMQSVYLGAKAITPKFPAFLQPVDTPFFQPETLQTMLHQIGDAPFVVPVFELKGGHPVLVSAQVLQAVSETNSHIHTLRDFLKNFDGKRLEVSDQMVLANINTPHDYERALADAP